MTETIPVRVQHKRMSARDWASSTLVLLDGELGVESDTGKVKVGNGRDRFSALQYLTGPKGDRGETGPAGPAGRDGVVTFENLSQSQRNSLKGDRGERGEQGPPGRDGQDGKPIKRNYILNSENLNSIPHWGSNKWDETIEGNVFVFTKTGGSDKTGFLFNFAEIVKTQFQNETLTWSIVKLVEP